MKFMVMNGFSGTGRTSGAIALAKELKERNYIPGLLMNDNGLQIVDSYKTAMAGCITAEVNTGCIGCQCDNMANELRKLRDKQDVSFVIAEMPCVCVCAVDHVYKKMLVRYKDEFELAPLAIVIDSVRLEPMIAEYDCSGEELAMNYMLSRQLASADLIILNKCDTLSETQIKKYSQFLQKLYPDTKIIPASFKDGRGVKEIADFIVSKTSDVRQVWKDTDKKRFGCAEKQISYYNQALLVDGKGKNTEFNDFLLDYVENIRLGLKNAGKDIVHIKLVGSLPIKHDKKKEYTNVSAINFTDELEFTSSMAGKHKAVRVVLNVRALATASDLNEIMPVALEASLNKFVFGHKIFLTESFGLEDVVERRYVLLKKPDQKE